MNKEHILFGRTVDIQSKKDLCGFWRSFAIIKIGNDYFGASSDEWLLDKESSVKEALSRLEQHFATVAQGTMVTQAREDFANQMARQQIAIDLINGIT
jgi:hypothetical protein